MQLKFIVSVVLYYTYLYLKMRENKIKSKKQCFFSLDLVVFLIPLFSLFSSDLVKMALFTGMMMVLSLFEIYKQKPIHKETHFMWETIILIVYLIPTIFYIIFFDIKYITFVYSILGLMLYIYGIIQFKQINGK